MSVTSDHQSRGDTAKLKFHIRNISRELPNPSHSEVLELLEQRHPNDIGTIPYIKLRDLIRKVCPQQLLPSPGPDYRNGASPPCQSEDTQASSHNAQVLYPFPTTHFQTGRACRPVNFLHMRCAYSDPLEPPSQTPQMVELFCEATAKYRPVSSRNGADTNRIRKEIVKSLGLLVDVGEKVSLQWTPSTSQDRENARRRNEFVVCQDSTLDADVEFRDTGFTPAGVDTCSNGYTTQDERLESDEEEHSQAVQRQAPCGMTEEDEIKFCVEVAKFGMDTANRIKAARHGQGMPASTTSPSGRPPKRKLSLETANNTGPIKRPR